MNLVTHGEYVIELYEKNEKLRANDAEHLNEPDSNRLIYIITPTDDPTFNIWEAIVETVRDTSQIEGVDPVKNLGPWALTVPEDEKFQIKVDGINYYLVKIYLKESYPKKLLEANTKMHK
jgi:hypothetical protein